MQTSTSLFKDILGASPFPVAVYIGEQLRIEYANPAMTATWGKGDDVTGKNYPDLLPEIESQQIVDQALQVLKTGLAFHARDKKVDLVIDGVMRTHYFNYSFIPLKDNQGNTYAVMNTGVDVTGLHLASQKAQSASERLAMLIAASGMGTYEIDLATKKTTTSENFQSIWSVAAGQDNTVILGKIHPDDLAVREAAHRQAQQTGIIRYDARIMDSDHRGRWTAVTGKIIRDDQNNPASIIGIVQDIEQQRAFEDELKMQVSEKTSELTRSNNDLMQFAAIVSHDLKEPVRKIKIYSTIIKDEPDKGSPNTQKYLSKIEQSAIRMQNIIEGLLSYSTADKAKQPVWDIDLGQIIEDIKIDLELLMKEKGAILVCGALPVIQGAPILIQQLFYNLLQNALKFSKANEPPRVTIAHQIIELSGRAAVEIAISDNGIGIDPLYAERIFSPFERLHSKNQYEGNGLGLALCRKIAQRHNGFIRATGEKDLGAEFTVTLPLKQPTESI